MRKIALLLSILFATAALAQQPPRVKPTDLEVVDSVAAPTPAPASLPTPASKDAATDDTKVTVIKKNGETFEEYRVRGKHVKTRVSPAAGPSYLLVDLKGDGNFVRADSLEPKGATAMWTILEW